MSMGRGGLTATRVDMSTTSQVTPPDSAKWGLANGSSVILARDAPDATRLRPLQFSGILAIFRTFKKNGARRLDRSGVLGHIARIRDVPSGATGW